MWPALPIALGVAAVLVLVSLALLRRRRSVWRAFARRHDLDVTVEEEGPRIEGRLADRSFELVMRPTGSDHGALGVEVWRMAVTLASPPPADLESHAAGGIVGELERATRERDLTTDDEDFDATFVVRADDADAARAWLDEDRRRLLEAFADGARPGIARLEDGQLAIEHREMVADAGRLERWRALLVETAERLDDAGRA